MKKLLPLFVLMMLAGCKKPATTEAAPTAVPANTDAAQIVVTKERTDLLFTFIDEKGVYHDVSKIEDVPEASRAQVLVRDLSKSPDELKTSEYLYVADLRSTDVDGRYSCGAVSRRAFDKLGALDAAVQAAQNTEQAGNGSPITLYTTSWCGVCRKTKAFLEARGLPFTEKDVEKDPIAAREVQAKAASKGLKVHGVPVIDVQGDLVMGFDQKALTQLLEKKGISKAL